MILLMVVLHAGAPLFTQIDPGFMDVRAILQPPSAEHPFGTDHFGRDLFSRVLYGGRVSLLVAAVVTALTTVLGILLGTLSGYFPWLDGPIMRAMDLVMAFPVMVLAIGIVAILGPQLSNIVIALVIPVTPRTARIVRAKILSIKEETFVTATKSLGAGDVRVILRHMIPNVMPEVLVRQTYVFGVSILIEGSLNFLGIGTQPEIATLGSIISDGRNYLRQMPWISFYAGLAITIIVLGVNLLGDGLRDVLDPKMKLA